MQILLPLFKDVGKLMVRNNYMFIYLWNPINIIQHSPEDGILTNLQQRLRKVLSQLP